MECLGLFFFRNVKNIQKLNQRELEQGNFGKKSWHDEYKNSAWVFIGGLPFDLTEGDVICVFSQLVLPLCVFCLFKSSSSNNKTSLHQSTRNAQIDSSKYPVFEITVSQTQKPALETDQIIRNKFLWTPTLQDQTAGSKILWRMQ